LNFSCFISRDLGCQAKHIIPESEFHTLILRQKKTWRIYRSSVPRTLIREPTGNTRPARAALRIISGCWRARRSRSEGIPTTKSNYFIPLSWYVSSERRAVYPEPTNTFQNVPPQ